MTLLPRVRRPAIVAVAFVFTLLLAPLAPALAAQSVRPMEFGQLRISAEGATGERKSDAHGRTEPGGTTRSVNIAIVGLGSLWIVLMVRRIQLQGAALRHAQVGH